MSDDYEILPPENNLIRLDDRHEAEFINPAAIYLLNLGSSASKSTMSSFLNIVARMLGYNTLHDCDWPSMRRHHLQMIIQMLKDSGKAPSTINTYLSALKGVAYEAWCLKQVDGDTLERIRAVKSVKGTRLPKGRALGRNEIRALLDCCLKDEKARGLRDLALMSVLIGCGLRRGEIVELDISSIITQERAFRVIGKGNKERYSFMPKSTWDNVQLWIEQCRGDGAGPLFARIRKNDDITTDRMTGQAIHYILNQRQVQAGIEKCAPHDLRRTFATMMMDNGEDIMTVKDSLGHASVNTTQRYIRHGHDKMKQAAERMTGI